jgi:hypothetical protein
MTRGISASALALLPPSHSQPAGTMPDKEKKKSRIRNLWDHIHHKSDPASNTTSVVNDGECTLWLFPQALTLHAARSLSSKDPDAGRQVRDASPSESQDSLWDPQPSAGIRPQEDGTLTVFRYLIDLTLLSRCFPG